MNKITKRLLAFLLTFVVAVGGSLPLLGGMVSDWLTVTGTAVSLFDDTAPQCYKENDTSNPYGLNPDANVKTVVSPVHELFVYKTGDNHSGAQTGLMQFRVPNIGPTINAGNGWVKEGESENRYAQGFMDGLIDESTVIRSYIGNDVKSRYVRMIAIDMYGSGRKDTLVSLWLTSDGTVKMEARKYAGNGAFAQMREWVIGTATWMINMDQVRMNNYLGITAGDYDGDGRDEVAVYANLDGDEAFVIRVYEPDAGTYSTINKTAVTNQPNEAEQWNKLVCSLASGDIDGDGIDDLIVSPGSNKSHRYSNGMALPDKNNYFAYYVGRVFVFKDSNTGNNTFNPSILCGYNLAVSQGEGSKNYNAIHSADVAVGDIDGDGKNEIVAAGYKSTMTVSDGKISGLFAYDTKNFGLHVYNYHENMSQTMYLMEMTCLQKGGLNASFYNCGDEKAKMCVECVATAGFAGKESIFVNGSFYNFANSNVTLAYTLNGYSSIAANNAGQLYVESTAVGNFNGDLTGTEQIYFTVVNKTGDSQGGFSYQLAYMAYEKNDKGNYGYFSFFPGAGQGTNCRKDIYRDINNVSNKSNPPLNYVPCAIDVNDDGLQLAYAGKGYTYADPEVIAVLQAAPYYKELDSDCGETSYSYATTYGKTTTEGNSVSFGVGVTADWNAGVYEGEIELGYALDWEESFEKSFEKSYEISFTATEYDTVCIQRTPVILYAYKVWDNDKKDWAKEKDHPERDSLMYLSVPQQPIYYQISVDEYNAYVDQYNAETKGKSNVAKLTKITKDNNVLPLGATGNPGKYYHTAGEAGNGWENLSDNKYFALSFNGGSIASSWGESSSMTSGSTMAHGFHFATAHKGGAEFFKVGGYVELDYQHSTGSYVTEAIEKGSSGSVSGLSLDDSIGFTEALSQKYGFNWTFGKWMRSLQTDEKGNPVNIPVFGYLVSDYRGLPLPSDDLNGWVERDGKLTLEWTDPYTSNDGWRGSIKGYNVYMMDSNGGLTKLNSSIIAPRTDKTYTFDFDVGSYGNTICDFIVRTVQSGTDYESLYSNVLSILIPKPDRKIINVKLSYPGPDTEELIIYYDDGTKDTAAFDRGSTSFNIAQGKCGFTGTESAWNRLVEDMGSAYDALVYIGYQGTAEDFARASGCNDGHIYLEYTVPAACNSLGFQIKVCKICGSTEFELIAAEEHSFEVETFVPDCVQRGYTVETCTKCGEQHFRDFVPAKGHSFTATVTEPTCTDKGYTTHTCSVCNETYADSFTDPTGHRYDGWKTMLNPSCEETGFKYRKCLDCSHTEIECVDATDHVWETSYTVDKKPTCTENGSKSIHCANCDAVKDTRVVAKTGHAFGDWAVTENATAAKEGKMERTCTTCGCKEATVIPMLLPNYPTSVSLDNTCVTLSLGDAKTLTAAVYPATATDKSVTWTSTDESVATVENGVITTVAPGFTVITVSTADSRYAVSQTSCLVYVSALNLQTASANVNVKAAMISGLTTDLQNLNGYVYPVQGCSLSFSQSVIGTGTTVDVMQNGEVIDSYTTVVYGDINGDGWYDEKDATVVTDIIDEKVKKADVGIAAWTASDCNHDGYIDETDISLLEQAGTLLAKVDRTANKTTMKASAAYKNYLTLIDQNPFKFADDEDLLFDPIVLPRTYISMQDVSYTLNVGETLTIHPVVGNPNLYEVVWSAGSDIVSISHFADSCTITANAYGRVNVTVKLVNSSGKTIAKETVLIKVTPSGHRVQDGFDDKNKTQLRNMMDYFIALLQYSFKEMFPFLYRL